MTSSLQFAVISTEGTIPATFYDQLSEQQVWKLPAAKHVFWVDAERCGKQKVLFEIGN
jgi:hypothetical protein